MASTGTPSQLLSVCIASYGYDVMPLVKALHQEFQQVGFGGGWGVELLVADQALSPQPNTHLWPWGKYYHRPNGLGRSENRNFLTHQAKGTHILYLDADAMPVNADFLQRYIESLQEAVCVVGGTAYEEGKLGHYLRVRVGKKREQRPLKQRVKHPHRSFSAFNFAIEKELALAIGFFEDLREYGHEDTLFGQQLQQMGVRIKHIDNAAYHLGIDGNEAFVKKTEEGVRSLAMLIELGKVNRDVGLYRAYHLVSRVPFRPALRLLGRTIMPALRRLLVKGRPPLWVFDLFKLFVLCALAPKAGSKTL